MTPISLARPDIALQRAGGHCGGHGTAIMPRRRDFSGHTVNIVDLPFCTTDWALVERVAHDGERGTAWWRTQHFGAIRVRMVEYSAGYSADHWCEKGHILLCLLGELHTELADGRTMVLGPGMSYQVADYAQPHRSFTAVGATIFIVD